MLAVEEEVLGVDEMEALVDLVEAHSMDDKRGMRDNKHEMEMHKVVNSKVVNEMERQQLLQVFHLC